MKMRNHASIKAVELISSGEDGVFVDRYVTGDVHHDGNHHPRVQATIHYNDGTRATETVVDQRICSTEEMARHFADQQVHLMAQAAKSKGIPVIIHTSGSERRRKQQHRERRASTAVDDPVITDRLLDKALAVSFVLAVCLVLVLR